MDFKMDYKLEGESSRTFASGINPSCRLPTASPGRWIGGRPPDMVASCDLSG